MPKVESAALARVRTAMVALALIYLAACGSDDGGFASPTPEPGLPDLKPLSAITYCTGCAPYRLEICVGNEGDVEVGDFEIAVNGIAVADLSGLTPGFEACVDVPYSHPFSVPPRDDVVWVDSGEAVEESDEENNTLSFPQPNPTGCDEVCFDTPTPVSTPLLESTPTPGAMATETAAPEPSVESTPRAVATATAAATPSPASSSSATPTVSATRTPVAGIIHVGGIVGETLPDGCVENIADATVEFWSQDEERYSTVTSDEGTFELFLPRGIYRTRYAHSDYTTLEETDFLVDSTGLQIVPVRLTPLEARQPFDDPTTGFGGTVYARGDQPVDGATLVFEREIDGLTRSVVSESGRYRILLPRGRYYTSASHPEAGIRPRAGFSVLCEEGVHTLNFFLFVPATPTPTPDPDNPRCGDGQVDEGEDCEPSHGFCSGGCGRRICIDNGCRPDCTCPRLERGGDSCTVDAFHGPGCSQPDCAACVCEIDPFCCEEEWDPICSERARFSCAEACQ